MDKKYFESVETIGALYLDYIFYEFEKEPILFSCVDKNKKIYLCLCTDFRFGQKWILTRCDLTILKNLITKRMEIASVFSEAEDIVVITSDLQGVEKSKVIKSFDIDPLDLPEEGTFLRCDVESAKQYLYQKQLIDSLTYYFETKAKYPRNGAYTAMKYMINDTEIIIQCTDSADLKKGCMERLKCYWEFCYKAESNSQEEYLYKNKFDDYKTDGIKLNNLDCSLSFAA